MKARGWMALFVPVVTGLVGSAACNAISGVNEILVTSSSGSSGGAASGPDGGGGGEVGLPSCQGLAKICGPSLSEDCCASNTVEGGTYSRTGDGKSLATVKTFQLDRFEVTVGRFRRFISEYVAHGRPRAGDGANPNTPKSGWDSGWDGKLPAHSNALKATIQCNNGPQGAPRSEPADKFTWTDAPGEHEALPLNCVSWYEAFAFCAWDGGFLPTEAEWGYAAAGGSEQRRYPWGGAEPIDTTFATFNCTDDKGTIEGCKDPGAPRPVGAASPKGDGRWGQADLAGNAFELTLDLYADYLEPCQDCAALDAAGMQQVLRGGGWYDSKGLLSTTVRVDNGGTRDSRSITVGFRCARAP